MYIANADLQMNSATNNIFSSDCCWVVGVMDYCWVVGVMDCCWVVGVMGLLLGCWCDGTVVGLLV